MHHHRSEHWVVVSGTGKVTIDDKIVLISPNESTYVPVGAKHRLENPGRVPLTLIEVSAVTTWARTTSFASTTFTVAPDQGHSLG
jgi:mannose-6-phosphate isomerase-like protein (cupin superfamily)